MLITSTFHPPSAPIASCKGQLSLVEFGNLIIAYSDRLEFYAFTTDGLEWRAKLDIMGGICDIAIVKAPELDVGGVAVLTSHPSPVLHLVQYTKTSSGEEPKVEITSTIQLSSPRYQRPIEVKKGLVASPIGSTVLVAVYFGKLVLARVGVSKKEKTKAIWVDVGGRPDDEGKNFNAQELTPICYTFIHPQSHGDDDDDEEEEDEFPPTLAILHTSWKGYTKLLLRDLTPDYDDVSLDTSDMIGDIDEEILDPDSSQVIYLHPPRKEQDSGGVVVIGGKQVYHFLILPWIPPPNTKGKGKPTDSDDEEVEEEEPPEPLPKKRGRPKKGDRSSSSPQKASSSSPAKPVKPTRVRRKVIKSTADWEWGGIRAHTVIDYKRILICTKFGELVIMSILDEDRRRGVTIKFDFIGITNPATHLTHLSGSFFFLSSPAADPLLISLSAEEPYIREIKRWDNIGPVLDACVVEKDGFREVITASGNYASGSLRVIRSGVDFETLAEMNIAKGLGDRQTDQLGAAMDIRHLWALPGLNASKKDQYILASTAFTTYLYSFPASSSSLKDEATSLGFEAAQATLACSPFNVRDTVGVVQVTRREVRLIDLMNGTVISKWSSRATITVASANRTQVAIAVKGGELILLVLGQECQWMVFGNRKMDGEVSALSLVPYITSKKDSSILLVGLFYPYTVSIHHLRKEDGQRFSPLDQWEEPIAVPHVPRSLLMTSFGHVQNEFVRLFVGLGSGSVVIFEFAEAGTVKEMRVVDLGTREVRLSHSSGGGEDEPAPGSKLIACGDRCGVFSLEGEGVGRVRLSRLGLKDIKASCPFSSEEVDGYQDCLVFAGSSGLVVGRIRNVQKLHIRSIHLGLDSPQQLVHHPELGLLGVGIQRTEITGVGEKRQTYHLWSIWEDATFTNRGRHRLQDNEEIVSAAALTLALDRSESPSSGSRVTKKYFVVGTVIYDENEVEPTRGRILIFDGTKVANSSDSNNTDWVVTSYEVNGCAYCLAEVKGYLLVGVNTALVVYRLTEVRAGNPTLTQMAESNSHFVVRDMVVRNDWVFVADLFDSISLFKVHEEEEGTKVKLEVVAKVYTSHWPLSIQAIGEDRLVGNDMFGNLFTYRASAVEMGEKAMQIEQQGIWRLGEVVNKFIPGGLIDVSETDSFQAMPKQLFFTSVGRIGILSEFPTDKLSLAMSELQRNLEGSSNGKGHAEWRRPVLEQGHIDKEPQAVGFLDGDFLETYLSATGPELRKIRQGKNEAEALETEHGQIAQILEKLQSIH